MDKRGYVLIKRDEHPHANQGGYVYEHVLVAETMMGGVILPGEEVHHRNENPSDNRPENLLVLGSHSAHLFVHRKVIGRALREEFAENELIECACGCGRWLERFDRNGRPRERIFRHTGPNPGNR